MASKEEMMSVLRVSNVLELMKTLDVVYEKGKYKALGEYYVDLDQALGVAYSQPQFEALKKGGLDLIKFNEEELERRILEKDFSSIPESQLLRYADDKVMMTTSYGFQTVQIKQELSVVTVDCVYGMNAFRDVFAGIRNLVGGRVDSIERLLGDGKAEVARALKLRSVLAGGNAIVGVTFSHQVVGDSSTGMMVAISGVGTAVRV